MRDIEGSRADRQLVFDEHYQVEKTFLDQHTGLGRARYSPAIS
jgi:hypothetical protein